MRLIAFAFVVFSSLALTGAVSAQATLPSDAVNGVNNPGSARSDAPVGELALDCTCRSTIFDAGGAASPPSQKTNQDPPTGDEVVNCTCRKTAPDRTGTLATPEPARTAPAVGPNTASAR